MPAIVNIKSTKNLTKAVNYASGYNGKAKAHNGYNMPRVLCQSGVNCTPKNGLKRMMDRVKRKQFLQDLKPKPRKIVQAYTLIQSFDASFDYKNINDVKKVNQLGQKLVGQVVPDKMALVFTQADGTHHMLHNHIIVCSLSENLKAMSGKQTNFRTWAKANDEVLKAEGLETLAPVSKTTTAKEKLTRAEIAEDSTEWGNYWNAKNSPRKVVETNTGSREEWCANNIYDLAVNVNEWTQERNKNLYRVTRGGDYGDGGDECPVAYRGYSNPDGACFFNTGFRATLYIK